MKDNADPRRNTNIAFVWDALAPQHVDKLNALVGMFKTIYGVQIYPTSWNYKWTWLPDANFDPLVVLNKRTGPIGRIFVVPMWCLIARVRRNVPIWFLCNYEEPYTFLSAIVLRLTGAKVFVVQNSKFDDYQRKLPMEIIKAIMYAPYNGAIVSGERTRSYLRFLGMSGPIQYGYNVADTERLGAFSKTRAPRSRTARSSGSAGSFRRRISRCWSAPMQTTANVAAARRVASRSSATVQRATTSARWRKSSAFSIA